MRSVVIIIISIAIPKLLAIPRRFEGDFVVVLNVVQRREQIATLTCFMCVKKMHNTAKNHSET